MFHHKTFRSVSNSENGEVSDQTTFWYEQQGDIVTAKYQGGSIVLGQLIAKMGEHGHLDMRYQHINLHGELMTGICNSVPEILPDGRIRLHESWQWTSGDQSNGVSVVEEVT